MHRPGSDIECPAVLARCDGQRLCIVDDRIGEALGSGLGAGHVGGFTHHAEDLIFRQTGFPGVDARLHLVPGVVLFRELPELPGVVSAPKVAPAVVDHDQTGGVDLHPVAGAHDQAAAAHGHAVHDADGLHAASAHFPQPVVDDVRDVRVAAVAVHPDREAPAALDLIQVPEELIQQDEISVHRFAGPPVDRPGLVDVAVHRQRRVFPVRAGQGISAARDVDGLLFHFFAHVSPPVSFD